MIGNLTIQSQAAKPSIGEIQVNLFAQPPLGADGEAIADNEHPDHQLRVDRGSANTRFFGCLYFQAYCLGYMRSRASNSTSPNILRFPLGTELPVPKWLVAC